MSSSDKDLPFIERVKLAESEQRVNFNKRQQSQRDKARVILDTVNSLVEDIIATAKDKYIQGIHNSDPNSKRKTIQLWEYVPSQRGNPNSGTNERIAAQGIEGVCFYTPFILTHGYKRLVQAHFPEENISITDLLQKQFETPEFGNGVDPLTGNKLKICVFTKKGRRSVFKNGIVLSRDGVQYDEDHIPERVREKRGEETSSNP